MPGGDDAVAAHPVATQCRNQTGVVGGRDWMIVVGERVMSGGDDGVGKPVMSGEYDGVGKPVMSGGYDGVGKPVMSGGYDGVGDHKGRPSGPPTPSQPDRYGRRM